jgi:hypothetical protein
MYGSTGGHWAKAKWDEPKAKRPERIIPFFTLTPLVHKRESSEKIAFFIGCCVLDYETVNRHVNFNSFYQQRQGVKIFCWSLVSS